MSSNVLADRDVNASAQNKAVDVDAKPDVKSMEYHRQVLQSKLEENKYVSSLLYVSKASIATGTSVDSGLIVLSQG